MKIRRFFATDMRQALRQVRENLGEDAVILSNKNVDGGVELVAAMDFDEHALPQKDEPPGVKQVAPSDASENPTTATAVTPAAQLLQPRAAEWNHDPLLLEMRREMQALRQMMENELSALSWRELGRHRPQTQELIRRLRGLDLGNGLCRDLAAKVEDAESLEKAWSQALFHLTNELPVLQDNLLDQGGVIALVGPTGVGKTTTIAKLAARYCMRHGCRQLALITMDNYRIGAQEQIHDYGRILDVPVRSVNKPEEFGHALDALSGKRLVLVDTAGVGLRDQRLNARLEVLQQAGHPVKTLLALSATTQRAALTQAIQSFAGAKPMAAVLTKLDEAVSLGGVFSSLMEAKLPLCYVTDGQRVPEDLHIAQAATLVNQAVELARVADEEPDEHALAQTFGSMVAHVQF